jgi:hypothetical protein
LVPRHVLVLKQIRFWTVLGAFQRLFRWFNYARVLDFKCRRWLQSFWQKKLPTKNDFFPCSAREQHKKDEKAILALESKRSQSS